MRLIYRYFVISIWVFFIIGYSISEAQWKSRRDMPTARYGLCSAVLHDKIFVIGGATTTQNMQMKPLKIVEVYDPSTDSWDTTFPDLRESRVFASAIEFHDKIYVFGGRSGNRPQDVLASVEMYDLEKHQWVRRASMPTPREGLAVAVLDEKIYAIGGSNADGILRTVERYDPEHDQWEPDSTSLVRPRRGFSAFTCDDMIIVVGGESNFGPLPFIEKYEEEAQQWRELNLRLLIPRAFYGGVKTDHNILIIAGESPAGTVPAVESFNTRENKLTLAVSFALPLAREKFTCVVVDNRIYAFGGVSPWYGQLRPMASNDELNIITDVADNNSSVPSTLKLHQNYPNPFNPTTTIAYEIPMSYGLNLMVTLEIFNLLGERVTTLLNRTQAPGTYAVTFDAGHLASGVYLYRLTVGREVITRRMVLLK